MDDVRRAEENAMPSAGHHAGYAPWIAVGAVVAGSVGAIIAATRSHRAGRQDLPGAEARPDSASVTAPHGDKLSTAL